MNDVLYKLYTVTGDSKHLLLAHLFDKPCILGLVSVKADDISGFHANTHIPIVIGAQMRYEVTGDQLYKEIWAFFMNIVNASHAYATGGTSVNKFWSDPKRLASTLQTEKEESCTTYNMLKGGCDRGKLVNFEACLDIMDLQYEKEDTSVHYNSPRYLAASILVASYVITVPNHKWEFPFIP